MTVTILTTFEIIENRNSNYKTKIVKFKKSCCQVMFLKKIKYKTFSENAINTANNLVNVQIKVLVKQNSKTETKNLQSKFTSD